MLVCNVSLRAPRRTISSEIVETASALDNLGSGSGQVVFATLVDDPASVNETVDAYLGLIMLETASADAAADATVGVITGPVLTTFNPADLIGVSLSGGNLSASGNISTNGGVRTIDSLGSGKHYFEYKVTGIFTNSMGFGICTAAANLSTVNTTQTGAALVNRGGNVSVNGTGVGPGAFSPFAVNDVIGVAVDIGASLIWFRLAPSGNWNGSGTANPATGTGGYSLSPLGAVALYGLFTPGFNTDATTANFGATAFTGTAPSGFNPGF